MKEKFNNIKEQAKIWWEKYKSPVKIGLGFFIFRALWGFAKAYLLKVKS